MIQLIFGKEYSAKTVDGNFDRNHNALASRSTIKTGNLVKETMIFPRYHQLDVVTKLLEDVKKNGSGKSYLIQHSAGSGKSNSIAWLAHRLTGLHDYEDNKIFQSVIIVTDRRVLDSQLQSHSISSLTMWKVVVKKSRLKISGTA